MPLSTYEQQCINGVALRAPSLALWIEQQLLGGFSLEEIRKQVAWGLMLFVAEEWLTEPD